MCTPASVRGLTCQQAEFRRIAERGILMDRYYALTHPSQPNYVAALGGSFWGMTDDDHHDIPTKYAAMGLWVY
jgi:hypothetical protein